MEPVTALSIARLKETKRLRMPGITNCEADQNQWHQDMQHDQPLCFTLKRKPEKPDSH
jgi:hypothetical protein